MTALLFYSLRSALLLTLLYVPYTMLLQRESFFRFNRAVLLMILVLSLLLPLLDVHPLYLGVTLLGGLQPSIQVGAPAFAGLVDVQPATMQADAVVPSVPQWRGVSWWLVLSYLYVAGVVVALTLRVVSLMRMRRTMRGGTLWQEQVDGMCVYCHADGVAPYSWMRSAVISQVDYAESGREILLHERGHALHSHSWDLLLLALVQVLQWWSPMVYLVGHSLRDVHEYEADDYVLSRGVSAREYQCLLVKKAVGASSYTFANSFHHSLTKKRITMMQRSKSNPWMRSRALYIVPVAAVALCAFATPQLLPSQADAMSPVVGKGKANPAHVQVPAAQSAAQMSAALIAPPEEVQSPMLADSLTASREVCDVPQQIAMYPGGDEALLQFLMSNLRYPVSAMECGVSGRVIVQFVIDTDGSLCDFRVLRKGEDLVKRHVAELRRRMEASGEMPSEDEVKAVTDACQALEDEAVRVLKLTPRWQPAMNDGQVVASRFVLPVTFRLQ